MKHFQWKEYFRAMIAQIASALEILIAFLVLVAIGAAGIRLVQDVFLCGRHHRYTNLSASAGTGV